MDENGQIFDLAKIQKSNKKHQNRYKNTHFSVLCRRKEFLLFLHFGTKKTPFSQSAFFCYGFRTAIQPHQRCTPVQAVDKPVVAVLAVVADSSAVAVQVVEPVELAEFAD